MILITGGGGFIGLNLALDLIDRGREVLLIRTRESPPAGMEGDALLPETSPAEIEELQGGNAQSEDPQETVPDPQE